MDKSLGTLLHFWGVFQFTQVQPLPSPNKQFWTRVSRIISEFQLCIGRGRKNCKKMSKRMHCFKRKPRNERKIWILQYCPGLLSRIVATASAILPYATSTFPIITLFAPRKILHKHCFQIWRGGRWWGQIRCIMGNVEVAYRAFSSTWPASMKIHWNERKRWHKKRVQLP